jgi:hypothetical protein
MATATVRANTSGASLNAAQKFASRMAMARQGEVKPGKLRRNGYVIRKAKAPGTKRRRRKRVR